MEASVDSKLIFFRQNAADSRTLEKMYQIGTHSTQLQLSHPQHLPALFNCVLIVKNHLAALTHEGIQIYLHSWLLLSSIKIGEAVKSHFIAD